MSDDMRGVSTKYMKNKRKQDKAIEAAEKKMHIKEAKRAKVSQLREIKDGVGTDRTRQLDPDNFKSITQIQAERAAAKKAATASSDEMDFDMDDDLVNGPRAGDTDSGEEDGDDDDDDSFATQHTSLKGSDGAGDKLAGVETSNGILDLRARLQARIQGLQSKRKAPLVPEGGVEGVADDESVASTKDELLEERRRKRGEMRDKRRLAMKERRKAERESGAKTNAAGGNAKKGSSGAANGGSATKAPALLVPDQSRGGKPSAAGQMSVDTSDLAFSSLQFGEVEGPKGKKNRHALPSDPKAALAILEARKKKDEARAAKRGEQAGSEADAKAVNEERKERERWSKAEAAVQGVKIRDDESLLKRAAKRKDKIKDKSRKEWADRDKEQKDQASARIKKRTDNIAARKERSKKGGKGIAGKKMGGGAKQTKARPGFEGKRRSKGGAAGQHKARASAK